MIPPPNVTGKLHLGHAWDTTLQDIIARYKRMQGYDMLWVPGMDHAGIATQAKVDERLKKKAFPAMILGREKFLNGLWTGRKNMPGIFVSSGRRCRVSLDYTRERLHWTKGLTKLSPKVFVDYCNDGLIYQGERIINWDPAAKTALSNIEVIHKETEGAMYTFQLRSLKPATTSRLRRPGRKRVRRRLRRCASDDERFKTSDRPACR